MVSLVVSNSKLLDLCSALMDEGLRSALFTLFDSPLSEEEVANALETTVGDAKKRLERLQFIGLVEKVVIPNNVVEYYALGFSMENPQSQIDKKIIDDLSNEISKVMYNFLKKHSDEITANCELTGASLARSVEQLFLSAFSSILNDYKDEMREEDKRMGEELAPK